jgi:hypothetical protein
VQFLEKFGSCLHSGGICRLKNLPWMGVLKECVLYHEAFDNGGCCGWG